MGGPFNGLFIREELSAPDPQRMESARRLAPSLLSPASAFVLGENSVEGEPEEARKAGRRRTGKLLRVSVTKRFIERLGAQWFSLPSICASVTILLKIRCHC